jgi:hypothetical protein
MGSIVGREREYVVKVVTVLISKWANGSCWR